MIDQMLIIHARRACRHASQARQAAVDVANHFHCGLALILQHVLDEVNAASRAVELIAQQRTPVSVELP